MILGEVFPDFKATTDRGSLDSFYKFQGESWVIIFSHPADFTPVCTTELARAAQLASQFSARNVKMLALSCDSAHSHREWIKDLVAYAKDEKITESSFPFEIIADDQRSLATQFGMLDPAEQGADGLPLSARAVFIVSPDHKLKAQILYPATTGRDFNEILRVVDSLQLTQKKPVATPEGWKAGGSCMIQPSLTDDKAAGMFGDSIQHVEVPSGKKYLRMVAQPTD